MPVSTSTTDPMIFGLEPADFVPFFGLRGVEEPLRFSVALAFSTILDAAAMWWRLSTAPDRRVGVSTICESLGAGAAAFLVKTPLLAIGLGFSGFGIIFALWCHLVFAVGTVATWLFGAALRGSRAVTPLARGLTLCGVLIWPCAAYARFLEPFRLRLEHATVVLRDRPEARSPLRIGVLADLQTDRVTDYERHVIATLIAEKPDLFLIPGDVFHGIERDFVAVLPDLRALLSELRAPLGTYFVTGDVDPPSYVTRLFDGTGIQVVDNAVREIDAPGGRLVLCGLYPDARPREAERAAREFATLSVGAAYRVAFSHRPDALEYLAGTRADVFIAGHTHGGQIVLPFLGPPLTLTHVPRHVAAGGLHDLGGRTIYVSRGAGLERTQAPRIRFLCPPEVSLLTLEAKGSN